MDFSFLRAEPFELPDPQALAIRGMTLANLSQTNQEGQMKLDALRRAQEGQAALAQVLPALQAAGYSKEAIAQALQANPTAAPYLIDYLNKKRKEDQDYEKTGAEITDKKADAAKKETDRKLAIADKFGNEAAWLADHPSLTPAMVADYQKRVAAAGLQDVLRVVPFQDWADPNKARDALKANSMQFYDIKDRIAAQETGRHNIATEGNQRDTLTETTRHNKASEGVQWAREGREAKAQQQGTFAQQGYDPNDGGNVVSNSRTGLLFKVAPGANGAQYTPYSGAVASQADYSKQVNTAVEGATSINRIKLLEKMVADNPRAFGDAPAIVASVSPSPYLTNKYNARALSPEERDVRAQVQRDAAIEINKIYGAALSRGEDNRATQFIPDPRDTLPTVLSKLRAAREYEEQHLASQGGGARGAANLRVGDVWQDVGNGVRIRAAR